MNVVFADGSRHMAQNTNDLRERWELRREFDSSLIRLESAQGYTIPQLDRYDDMDAMLEMKTAYINMLVAIDARRRIIGFHPKFSQLRNHLITTREEVTAAQAVLKQHIVELRVAVANGDTHQKYQELKAYTHELEQILIDERLKLPALPFEGWKVGTQELKAPSKSQL